MRHLSLNAILSLLFLVATSASWAATVPVFDYAGASGLSAEITSTGFSEQGGGGSRGAHPRVGYGAVYETLMAQGSTFLVTGAYAFRAQGEAGPVGISSVPLPGSMSLFVTALVGAGVIARRKLSRRRREALST